MAITPGTSTATSGNRTTGFTLVIDAGVVAGDILLLGVTNRGAITDSTVVDDDTGGNTWAKISNQNADTNGAITVWWKRATSATASKTITVSGCTNSCAGCVTPYTGALATGNPYGTPVPESNASGNETTAGITTTAAGSFVCLFVGLTSNDTLDPNTYVATDPTTLSERAEGVSSGGSDCSMSHASAARATAGATGNISWSQTDGTGASIVFELKPAAVAYSLTADPGSVAVTGTAATLTVQRKVTASAGAVAVTGTAAGLARGFSIAADSGSLALTGAAAGLTATRMISAASGSLTVTGTAASLEYGRTVIANAGSFTITGTDATLTHDQGSSYTLSADPGSVSATGTDASLEHGRTVIADSGTTAITGTAATLTAQRKIVASPGSVAIGGTAATLTRTYRLAADAGAITLTGTAATTLVGRLLNAGASSFTVTGTNATLTHDSGGGYTLTAGAGVFAIVGSDGELTVTTPPIPKSRKHTRSFGERIVRARGEFARWRRVR